MKLLTWMTGGNWGNGNSGGYGVKLRLDVWYWGLSTQRNENSR